MTDQNWIHELAEWLTQESSSNATEQLQQQLMAAQQTELDSIFGVLQHILPAIEPDSSKPQLLLQLIAVRCKQIQVQEMLVLDSRAIAILYEQLVAIHQNTAAAHLLQILALQADWDAVRELADCLKECSLEDWKLVGIGLSPLWQAPAEAVENFFEELGQEYLHPAATGVLLDLANYSLRNGRLESHPWKGRSKQLGALLQQLISRLRMLEREPQQFGETVEEVQKALGDSVSLTVSLCDSLGWIGDATCSEMLEDALLLSHRRIQTEAAAALARLGNEAGKKRLIALAADSAARIRVVAYAEELEILHEIPPEFRTEEAVAESELSSWLAEAARFGLPPQEIELLDSRTQHWPSYEEPRNCYLFRYTYTFPQGQVKNVGMSGPLTHSFTNDVNALSVDDLYALFAGWQAEHEEIFEVPAHALNSVQRQELEKMQEYLAGLGFEDFEPIALALFFGEVSIVTNAKQSEQPVVVVTDGNEVVSFPVLPNDSSMNAETTLCLYRGRKLLRTFNS